MKWGWSSPSEYVLIHWCFSATFLGPIRFVRVLGFYFDWSKRAEPCASDPGAPK